MQIQCPNCKLTGQISNAQIPPEGLFINCPKCKTGIEVRKPVVSNWHETLTDCPVCKYSTFSDERFDLCPKCGLVVKEYLEQQQGKKGGGGKNLAEGNPHPEMDTVVMDREKLRMGEEMRRFEEEQRARHTYTIQETMNAASPEVPDATTAVPLSVQVIGWLSVAVAVVLIIFGGRGLYAYSVWTPPESVLFDEPPSKLTVFLTVGLLPGVQFLLGLSVLIVAGQFLKLRAWARDYLEIASWTGLAVALFYEATMLVVWIRKSSNGAGFSYYAVGVVNMLLMAALWAAPILAGIRLLRAQKEKDIFF